MRKRLILWALFLVPSVTWGQLEHVPASNLVYDFLNHMQVRGYVPDYNRSFIPATRREVVAWLHEVNQHNRELSETERELALRFRQEFIDEADRRQARTVLFSGKDSWSKKLSDIFSDKEKFLYTWRDPSDTATTFFMEGLASFDARSAVIDGEVKHVSLGQIGGRFRGTIRGIVGYGLQSTNGTTFGDRNFALTDPVLRQNTAFTDFNSDYFDFTEAYVSVDFDWGRLSLGKERVFMGSGLQDKLYISSNAPTFDAVRFDARFKTFRYTFIHSSLLSKRIILDAGEPFYNPKFLALHRAQVALFDAVDFGVYEAVIYSRRFLDLAYLNPINFFKSAEHSNGDRDNPLLAFDLQSRGIPDLQLYGTWLIDDVDFSRWGTGWFGNKFAWQAGMQTTAVSPDLELTLEYTRIEPYVYSHVFPDNSYTHREINLGPTIQPNSYAVSLGMMYWLGYKWRGSFLLRHMEHGANVYDEEGNLVRNTGGDVLVGYRFGRDDETARLLDGDLETENLLSFSLRYEPWRNIIWDFVYQLRVNRSKRESRTRHFISLLLLIEY